ncbi:2-succinyl-5-enolpyruvyl-6-hydroxy-3-cyclohexene-1-carboxylic-acid synthase [Larkinella soli]|uniref:2-succinyl-5-enolpyruvyl-6-hydroxy-3- cyclohexene-1-carboxylic-acid synthase n=1 Tax=Larkinella soli TaxID=1770527 RepID=UPI000FFB9281|nr:2-succinyl-5-enolpyruvyl-6-hydroxy-3-cyclohexene-1-carboxylic-acid synthase [Larkinella soli]
MAIHQAVLNVVELCVRKGVTNAVISPGSRSAPLTLALARHPKMHCRVVADERSAGFIALGLAQQTRKPVIVVCTSGSAVYNLAPAVAEAYFQEIPLLVLTADRPKEWIHQQDGQTIFQSGIFGQHVKQGFEFPSDFTHPDATWFSERIGNEALNLTLIPPFGPVHINIPLREPLYPTSEETFRFGPARIIDRLPAEPGLPPEVWHRLQEEWESAERKLIAVGQGPYDPALLEILEKISGEWRIPVLGDIISNLGQNGEFISQHDLFLSTTGGSLPERLQPDLLVTIGKSFLSKSFKLFLRKYRPRRHWHIQPHDRLADPFQSLTTQIPHHPVSFFQKLFSDIDFQHFVGNEEEVWEAGYQEAWQSADRLAQRTLNQFLVPEDQFHEWAAVRRVLDALPEGSQLHLANSMPVRYANFCGLETRRNIEVFANRGTSGIDGCLSTAVGAALATDKIVTVLIGDVAFFYDRNALWNNLIPKNLRIVLLNNHGGNIFRIIDGPAGQPELDVFFETSQPLSAENTARDARIRYRRVSDFPSLKAALGEFYPEGEGPALLEIETDRRENAARFRDYKSLIRKAFPADD